MSGPMKKLLCAVDGSHSANRAAAWAAELARSMGASLTFVTVNTVSELEMAREPMAWDSEVAGAAREQVRMEFAEAVQAAGKSGLEASACVEVHGRDIAGAIVRHAEEGGFDHLVLGSRGLGSVSRLLLGSVATQVVREAHCPVTVVK